TVAVASFASRIVGGAETETTTRSTQMMIRAFLILHFPEARAKRGCRPLASAERQSGDNSSAFLDLRQPKQRLVVRPPAWYACGLRGNTVPSPSLGPASHTALPLCR